MDFEAHLTTQVLALPKWSFRRRVLLAVLNLPHDDPRRAAALLRMEHEARVSHGVSDTAEMNWAEGAANGAADPINWAAIMQAIFSVVLPILLKMLIGL